MTPEQTALLQDAINQVISADDIAEVLPLTEGDGSIYRKDETGVVNHTKVVTGAEHARVNFNMSMPKLSSHDFKTFIQAAKILAETNTAQVLNTYSDNEIEKVKTGGITGAIANEIIKKQHGQ